MITTSVLMCHAPIVIPEIGGVRSLECEKTTRAMRQVAEHLLSTRPRGVILLSPHAPRYPAAFGVRAGDWLEGDFGSFGHPELRIRLPNAPELGTRIVEMASARGVRCQWAPSVPLDHGALVPLYFLQRAGWCGPTVVISLPAPDTGLEAGFGQALRDAVSDEPWAVLASGDLSHRLQPGAPAGYHPRAASFDSAFVAALGSGDYRAACGLDEELQDLAAQDVVQSVNVATSCVDYDATGHALLHYEGPFGVGYAEAILYDSVTPPRVLLEIARGAIDQRSQAVLPLPVLDPPWQASRGVFVTLRTPDGKLRGCVGRVTPACASLVEEVAQCAVSSATEDPRFPPVDVGEADDLSIEVSILDAAEPIATAGELDPSRYGVVVTCGTRRGVLLPNVEGIDTVEAQLDTARRKAGISSHEPCSLHRFLVHKLKDAPT